MTTRQWISGVVSIAAGVFFVLSHRWMGDEAIRNWYAAFPDKKIYERGFSLLILFIGIIFIVLGILDLLGMTKLHD